MNFLISFCLNNRITVILLTLALAVISIFVVKNIPVDVFPELKVPRVTIQTEAPGLTAEEVEQYITIPIESAMNGTAGVKGVRSSSGSGLSFVWVDFDWDKDIYQARQIVTERLGAVRESLPEGTSPELAPIVSVTGEIMLIALTGDKDTSTLDMRQLAEYKLRTRLLAIPGVGQVTVLGGRLPEYQMQQSKKSQRCAQQHRPADLCPIQPTHICRHGAGGQPQRQHQTAQPSGQQKKQRRQSPRMGLPPPRRQRHGGSPSRPAQRVRQPAKPRQEHRTGVQRPDGGAQSQPSSPQGDTRQLGRGQEQQIVYQQIQQEHPVQIHHRHAASPPSAGHIIPSAAGKKRQKKRGPHRSSPHVPHTPIPGRGFTGSGMAQ